MLVESDNHICSMVVLKTRFKVVIKITILIYEVCVNFTIYHCYLLLETYLQNLKLPRLELAKIGSNLKVNLEFLRKTL